MRVFKNIILGFGIIILIAIIGSYFFVQHVSKKALPDYNKSLVLKNLTDEVTVYRDKFAVPHIYAKNESDLYRAVGYTMAQDRLWQMDLLRHATTGRLSEIFGKDLVKTDRLLRALRISEKSKMVLKKTDPKILKALNAFTDGVNQFIEENMDNLPPEFTILGYEPEVWEPYFSINLTGYMTWDLTMGWSQEILLHKFAKKISPEMLKQLIPDMDLQKTEVFPEFSLDTTTLNIMTALLEENKKLEEMGLGIFNASNNWVVPGKKSTTGKPIFANDMHLGLFAPGIWYQMHQVIEGKLNVTGLVIPGEPMVVAGHNDSIAWGMTNVMLDNIDFYAETINPENPNEYKFNGKWRSMEVRTEKIKTKNGNIVEKIQKYTHRGPIISEFKDLDEAISFRWTGNDYSNEVRTIYLLNRANNWIDFRDAVKTFISVSQNIAYADINGNIGLQTCAGIPIRDGDGISVYPGDTSQYDWKGMVPFEDLPYSYNPKSGYVSSANNKTVGADYPYYISHWFYPPYRIDRIREMLEEKDKLSVDDFKRMHLDQHSKLVEKMLPDMVEVLSNAKKLSKTAKSAFEKLKEWNGTLSKESIAATIFESFYLELVKNTVKDELGEKLFEEYFTGKLFVMCGMENIWKDKQSKWYDNVNTKKTETYNDIVIKSFKKAVKNIQKIKKNNVDEWQWGSIHKLTLKHPMGKVKLLDQIFGFNSPAYPVGGSFHTVSPYSYVFTKPFDVNYGPSHRHIYSTANWDSSYSVIPTGTSGIPASPYYCDQTKLYVNGKYHHDYLSKKEVEKAAIYKMTYLVN